MDILKNRLDNLEITDIHKRADSIRVEAKTHGRQTSCPHCHSDKIDKHGRHHERLIDAPINNQKVLVTVSKARYKCNHCKKTFLDPVYCKFRDLRMTKQAAIEMKQRFGTCFTSKIARDFGVDRKTIVNAVN